MKMGDWQLLYRCPEARVLNFGSVLFMNIHELNHVKSCDIGPYWLNPWHFLKPGIRIAAPFSGPLEILSRAGERGLWLCSAWLGLSFGPGYGGMGLQSMVQGWKDRNVSACVQVVFLQDTFAEMWAEKLKAMLGSSISTISEFKQTK